MPDEHDRRRGGDDRRLDQDVVEMVVNRSEGVRQTRWRRRVTSFELVDAIVRGPTGRTKRVAAGHGDLDERVLDRDGQPARVGVRVRVRVGARAASSAVARRSVRSHRASSDRRCRRRWRGDGQRVRGGTSRRCGCRRRRRTGAVRHGRRGWPRRARRRSGRGSRRSLRGRAPPPLGSHRQPPRSG